MAKVYLSLGSNLGDRENYLASARDFIKSRIGSIVKESSVYESEPWGFDADSNFLNQVLKVETQLSPAAIMLEISYIESKLGRERTGKGYSSRTIDIDVLFYDHLILYTPELIVPHKQLHKRNFIIEPLKEIAPDFIHPLFSITVTEIAITCNDDSKVWRYEPVNTLVK
ncbi:MAG: 2-amino-4-hydroxy-6-hydroxymethyldihydropteridine diphosphokinase [Tenuifilum sp.]|jgi:2-amino-4-hydroxy-6-hydroxymethyldihydropteridine diphosphokinase|uniref:2-amino-4-hydroxy-6- hydroxymethyldihydropteridine diphosphokinase n=1 Tax=Tenuifilum sp. TaxID=2760880 RepID=UPI0024AB6CF1|nr:2-amino-4-hydroxy-6-hydroxymethyldihydropteridine diphosphokinase [Tenuifilum sp.]MDI3528010.1 2-amino-4-hydroxy-6-hydroxymethyldihydropteridine diphosphokinase [Tenuifilum sp.]